MLAGFVLLVAFSMAVSAFVDNVPFLAAMLPVVAIMSDKLNMDPTLYMFGLLLGASIGGNITPIGAASNIVCVGLLRKENYNVKFGEFVRIGLPFTLVSLSAACLFLWIIWAP
jgi:Na+/H+ antiporter NhaD/arsenite permease-like protein